MAQRRIGEPGRRKKKEKKSYESKKSRRINLSIKKKFFLMDISGRTMSF